MYICVYKYVYIYYWNYVILKMNNYNDDELLFIIIGFKSVYYTLGSIWYSKSPKIPIVGLKLKYIKKRYIYNTIHIRIYIYVFNIEIIKMKEKIIIVV